MSKQDEPPRCYACGSRNLSERVLIRLSWRPHHVVAYTCNKCGVTFESGKERPIVPVDGGR